MSTMFVVKRDGRQEQVHFDKITARITKLSYGLSSEFCDPVRGPLSFKQCFALDAHEKRPDAPS